MFGAPAGLLLLVSAVAQLGAARLAPLSSIRAGCLVLAVGLPAFAALSRLPTAGLLLASLLVLGVGHGLTFLGGLRLATSDSADSGTTGRFFAVTYVGSTAQVLAVGVLATVTGIVPAVAACSLLAALACVGVAAGLPRVLRTRSPRCCVTSLRACLPNACRRRRRRRRAAGTLRRCSTTGATCCGCCCSPCSATESCGWSVE